MSFPVLVPFVLFVFLSSFSFGMNLSCADYYWHQPARTKEVDSSLGREIEIERVTVLRKKMNDVLLEGSDFELSKNEIAIGMQIHTHRWETTGHAFLMTSEYRFDGGITAKPLVRASRIISANTVLFRFSGIPDHIMKELNAIVQSSGRTRLTCVSAVCRAIQKLNTELLPREKEIFLSKYFEKLMDYSQNVGMKKRPKIEVHGDFNLAQYQSFFSEFDRAEINMIKTGSAFLGGLAGFGSLLVAINWLSGKM